MRVTEKLKFLSSHANINRLRSEQQKKMMQLSSGRRVNQLSDDALAAKRSPNSKRSRPSCLNFSEISITLAIRWKSRIRVLEMVVNY